MVHLNSSFGRDRHCNSNYPLRIQKTRTSIRDNQRLLLVALLTCLNRTGFDARWYRYFADLSPKSPHPRQWVVNGGLAGVWHEVAVGQRILDPLSRRVTRETYRGGNSVNLMAVSIHSRAV